MRTLPRSSSSSLLSRRDTPAGRERHQQEGVAAQILARLSVGFLLMAWLAGPAILRADYDNFDDGDDAGWTHYSSFGNPTYTFPDGAYRLMATADTTAADGYGARIFSYRSPDYTDTFASVDFVAWGTNANQAIGLLFRLSNVGPGTSQGYVLNYNTGVSGGGTRALQMNVIVNDRPFATIAAAAVYLEPTRRYRMVATAVGTELSGYLYDALDLTVPIITLKVDQTLFASGKNGLFVLSRRSGTNIADATFDNFVSQAGIPTAPPFPALAHSVPGTAQVLEPQPPSNRNLHPAASGVRFRASTLGTNEVDAAKVRLVLNGSDVSANLNLTGPKTNLTVEYRGLRTNQIYHAQARVQAVGGGESTHEWYFDTFEEDFLFSSRCKVIEAEDYNYEYGKFQNDPPPSGYTDTGGMVNGNGIGYLDVTGIQNVDFFDYTSQPAGDAKLYRAYDPVATGIGSAWYIYLGPSGQAWAYTNDTLLKKFTAVGLKDYQVWRTEGGEWLNYTRTFTTGRYVPFLRLGSYAYQDVLLQEVTSDPSLENQTTNTLGRFRAANTGHQSIYRYFPLLDDAGNWKALDLAGTKTLRLAMDGPRHDPTRNALQLNYLVLIPSSTLLPEAPRITSTELVGGQMLFRFASAPGVVYVVERTILLNPTSWQEADRKAGDGTTLTVTNNVEGSAAYFRLRAE